MPKPRRLPQSLSPQEFVRLKGRWGIERVSLWRGDVVPTYGWQVWCLKSGKWQTLGPPQVTRAAAAQMCVRTAEEAIASAHAGLAEALEAFGEDLK